MDYQLKITKLKDDLLFELAQTTEPESILKNSGLKQLYGLLAKADGAEKPKIGQAINDLKQILIKQITLRRIELDQLEVKAIDISAPSQLNQPWPSLLPTDLGTKHPLTKEIERVIDIFVSMGFESIISRQIDDEFNMFESLNFPKGHPARDGYDSFKTKEGFIPPAHTSTMQYRIMRAGLKNLKAGGNIAAISCGRVFRNEDVDATHEHTFHQYEGVYIDHKTNLGQMLGVLKAFFEVYYQHEIKIKTQPAYFPFVEPGLEFLIEKPKSIGGKSGEWLEMLGCGMIHPEVLKTAGIDPAEYRGFAWGGGFERLVMLKYGIQDIRLFESAKLEFLREF